MAVVGPARLVGRGLGSVPPPVLVVGGIVSLQVGSAIARQLFPVIGALGAEVSRVEVTRIDDGTFYAEVTLSTALGDRVVDARPSDAVALATRVGAGIWVADEVMEEAGVPDVLTETDAAESLDEFKRFLDDVEPEDFEG